MMQTLKSKNVVRREISKLLKKCDDEGNTLLHYVAQSDDKEFAEKLIAAGCNVNAKNNDGLTPLYSAIYEYQVDMFKLLLKAGADCDNLTNKQSALHVAAYFGNPKIVLQLIEHGNDVNALDNEASTPLHYTVRGFDKQDENFEIIKMLVDAGANVNLVDGQCNTPLMITVQYNYEKGFEFLLSMGADCRTEGKMDFNYPKSAVEICNTRILDRLLGLGYDINMKDDDGNSLLHFAVEQYNCKMIHFLLNNNAKIDVNNDGLDPLSFSLPELIEWFRFFSPLDDTSDDFDEEIEKDEDKNTFHTRYTECMDILIDHGLNLNYVSKDGMTTLYFILDKYKSLHSNYIKILLKNGAKFDFEHPSVREVMNNSNGSKFPRLLVRHAATFEAQNRSDDGPANFDINKLNKELKKYYASCRDELELMKWTKIGDENVSFFNILVNKDIGPYVRNESIRSAFKLFNTSKYFPIFKDLLSDRFPTEVKLQKLVKKNVKNEKL